MIDLHELFEVEGDTLGHTRGLYCTGHVDKAEFAARANRWEADVRHVLWRRETYCESIGEPCARECSCNWNFSESTDGQAYTVWDWDRPRGEAEPCAQP